MRDAFLASLAIMLLFARSASAQAPDPAVAELRALIEQQRVLLDEQGRDLRALQEQVAVLTSQLTHQQPQQQQPAAASRQPAAANPPVAAVSTSAVATPAAATAPPAEQVAQRGTDLPTAVVSAGEFPGSIRIPGTNSALKIGGQVRMTLVHTLGPLGTDDRFVTSSIPVEGEQQAGEESRTNYSVAPSRINFDLRSPIPRGALRTFIEADFANGGNGMRLRHAYMQTRRFLDTRRRWR